MTIAPTKIKGLYTSAKTQAEVKEKLKAALEECQRLDVSRAGDRWNVLPGRGERHQQKDSENTGAGTHSGVSWGRIYKIMKNANGVAFVVTPFGLNSKTV